MWVANAVRQGCLGRDMLPVREGARKALTIERPSAVRGV